MGRRIERSGRERVKEKKEREGRENKEKKEGKGMKKKGKKEEKGRKRKKENIL